jgi:hypothetical protein
MGPLKRRIPMRSLATAVLAGLVALPAVGHADEGALPLRLSAFAVDMNNVGRSKAGRIEIVIERWTTDAERKTLIDTLVEKGSDALMKAVQNVKPRAGYIRTSTSLGWDIQFARMTALPDGARRLVFATDRPMSFYELRHGTRSADYDFMLAEIHLTPQGKGQGKLATAAKITYDKEARTMEIEDYGTEPVRLNEVTVEGSKKK